MNFKKTGEGVPFSIKLVFILSFVQNWSTSAVFARITESKGRRLKTDHAFEPLQPRFEDFDVRVVTVAGSDVVLPCRVSNLDDKLVSWIRSRDLQILTSGPVTFTADDRFQVHRSSKLIDWSLNVKKVKKTDSGQYECQVNTDPKMSRIITLDVVSESDLKKSGKKWPGFPADSDLNMVDDEGVLPHNEGKTLTRVLGKKEQYVKTGSTITFTCLVLSPSEPVHSIEWLKDGRQVSFKASRGGIIVDTEKSETKATSRLTLADVKMEDSGNYTCKPGNAYSHSVMLIVVAEERTEAMKRHNNSGQSFEVNWQFIIIICVFLQFAWILC